MSRIKNNNHKINDSKNVKKTLIIYIDPYLAK